MNELQQKIINLKKEKNALILAHYYQTMDVQEVADHVCDSFEMAKRAFDAKQELLIICGVHFMAESAKLLNPGKTVLIPKPDAGCPMADMITPQDVTALKNFYPDAAVVCYVNSSAAVKAVSDICCTSSSAERIVKALPERQIIFIPDRNLGAYISSKVTDKEFIFHKGWCPVHDYIVPYDVENARLKHPNAKVLTHPECRPEVLELCDFIGSTSEIISFALESDNDEFIIGTESGVTEHLAALAPDKIFYPLTKNFICEDMKKTTLKDILSTLETGKYEITVSGDDFTKAKQSLERMVKI
ncbi:MAG: quinolinate synthase NadA [Oscillospiraceae bacterium]|nr:quinolinate synthase NadA [Oscillospiraceae bacterium]